MKVSKPLTAAQAEVMPGAYEGKSAAKSAKAAAAEIAKLKTVEKTKRNARHARPVAKAEPPAKGARKVETSGDRVPLKKIAGSLGIDPKKARVHLRKALRAGGSGLRHEIGEQRWSFTAAQVPKVKEILRPYA